TRNLIKRKYRDLKLNANIDNFEEEIIDTNNIELNLYRKDKNEVIIQELNKMKNEDKDIFIMYYYENIKLNEISRRLKISESKVKVKLYRIRKKLKKVLNERGYVENE
ncbi:MAG: sigma-70 family RNA polymerase sigma factor, partial [Clostridia bacterium]|nr:sigma-70 family RNA polymerase sigma factor [Clostridia bacterium]